MVVNIKSLSRTLRWLFIIALVWTIISGTYFASQIVDYARAANKKPSEASLLFLEIYSISFFCGLLSILILILRPFKEWSEIIVVVCLFAGICSGVSWQRYADQESGLIETRYKIFGQAVIKSKETDPTVEFVRTRLLRQIKPQWKASAATYFFGLVHTKHADDRGPVYEFVHDMIMPAIQYGIVKNMDEAINIGRTFVYDPQGRRLIFMATISEWLGRTSTAPGSVEYSKFLRVIGGDDVEKYRHDEMITKMQGQLFSPAR